MQLLWILNKQSHSSVTKPTAVVEHLLRGTVQIVHQNKPLLHLQFARCMNCMSLRRTSLARHIMSISLNAIRLVLFLCRYYAGWADKNHGKVIPMGAYSSKNGGTFCTRAANDV